MEIYLDNSATTKCFPGVAQVVMKTMLEDYGNPSSMHQKGVDAEKYMRDTRSVIASNLKVQEKEIFFTSGGTESDNLALIGVAMANQRAGKHLITTQIEHPAVLETMKYLETQGFSVTYLPVDHDGIVELDALRAAMTPETILVSVMFVNNEIGSVQPIEEISKHCENGTIPRRCSMWMRCRPTANTGFIPSGWALICWLFLGTRSTAPRASACFTFLLRQRCGISITAAASRRGCVPGRTMCRASQASGKR